MNDRVRRMGGSLSSLHPEVIAACANCERVGLDDVYKVGSLLLCFQCWAGVVAEFSVCFPELVAVTDELMML